MWVTDSSYEALESPWLAEVSSAYLSKAKRASGFFLKSSIGELLIFAGGLASLVEEEEGALTRIGDWAVVDENSLEMVGIILWVWGNLPHHFTYQCLERRAPFFFGNYID